MSDPQYARDPSSLTSIIDQFEEQGFTGQLAARPGAMLLCLSCRREHPAAEFSMTALRRTEGASDPDDMAAVVALTCPHCQAKGTVVLKYGPEASIEDAEALVALDDDRTHEGVILTASDDPDAPTA